MRVKLTNFLIFKFCITVLYAVSYFVYKSSFFFFDKTELHFVPKWFLLTKLFGIEIDKRRYNVTIANYITHDKFLSIL